MNEEKKGLTYIFSEIALFTIYVWVSYLLIFRKILYVRIIDDVNLLMHEAGHLVFSVFGDFLEILGGTIMQLFIPILFIIYFLRRADNLGVSFSLFWLGVSLINVSHYVADARTMWLPLIGGGLHDWNQIFTRLQILDYAESIGLLIFYFGSAILISTITFTLLNLIKSIRAHLDKI